MGEGFSEFKSRVNLIFVVDHAGRAGNGFFQTIFDLHNQVIACPWMHYVYSYILTGFGDSEELNSREVWGKWRNSIYFSCLYYDLDEDKSAFVTKFGGNPSALLDRVALRASFDEAVLSNDTITRKDLVVAIFYSYAIGLGRDISAIKYIMTSDSISLRYENAISGFSGKVIDFVLNDFEDAKMIHMVRDPRAGFASSNHQFVNELGNMYGLKLGNFWQRLTRLTHWDFDWDCVFVFGFWLIYFRQTYEAIMKKRGEYDKCFITVRNEDLNTKFVDTISKLADILDINTLDIWTHDFQPTMLGSPWTGTGAYNNQYQKYCKGPLKNDPDAVARKVTGPNVYVTQRWRERLSNNEIFILEGLLSSELQAFDYDFLFWRGDAKDEERLFHVLWKPLRGELPSLRWVLDGWHVGVKSLIDRIFYCLAFPVFYIASRMVIISLIRKTNIFSRS